MVFFEKFKLFSISASSELNILSSLSSCSKNIYLLFNKSVHDLIDDYGLEDFSKSTTEELIVSFNHGANISLMVYRQLLEIFPNVKRLSLIAN